MMFNIISSAHGDGTTYVTGQCPVEHQSEAPPVHSVVVLPAQYHLRCLVFQTDQRRCGLRLVVSLNVIVEEDGIVEVRDEYMSVFANEDALRGQSGMNDP